MLSPSSLFSKIIGVLAKNGGENGTNIIVVSAVCRSWTWHLSAFVLVWGHIISFSTCLYGFGWSLLTSHLLFALSPWPLIFWCQILPNPLSCRQYVQEKLTSANFNIPLILIWSWFTKTLCSSVSRRWCGKHYGPPSIKVTSCRLQLIIREADLENPFWYLGACMPQWQVLRIQWKVFIIGLRSHDFTGFRCQLTVHILWILPIVPWGPSSFLVVSLASVNNVHHWLVIGICSFMFDFSLHIRMLELVLCSGRDGAQDTRFCLIIIQAVGSLWIIMTYYMTLLIGWLQPYLSLLVNPYFAGWLRPYLGSQFFYTLLWMVVPIPHILYQGYQLYFYSRVFWR